MQQIIGGKRYNTATAEKVASAARQSASEAAEKSAVRGDARGSVRNSSLLSDTVKMFYQGKAPGAGDLYRTKKGHWFVHEWESHQLIPVSRKEAKAWCEKFGLYDVIQARLTDVIEEA